jgi:putative membrane protein
LRQASKKENAMMYYRTGIGGWGMVLMAASNLLFWGLLVAGTVALVYYLGRRPRQGGSATDASTPQRVLAERFARGEIDEEDYTRRLQVLGTAARTHGVDA